jgi:hypothetical protein
VTKIVVHLAGHTVMKVDGPRSVEVEVRQYTFDFQEGPVKEEEDWPGLKYTVAWPLPKPKRSPRSRRRT